ncbi:MAG: peptidoglycan-binding protein [Lysobacterales bacterium]
MPRAALTLFVMFSLWAGAVSADDLTQMIQEDLSAMGYDTGGKSGEMNTKTAIAISKFQAEHDLDVTGEPSPQLAGILRAAKNDKYVPAGSQAPKASPAAPATQAAQPATTDVEALRAAQQACLKEKMEAAQKKNKKKRGFGRLMSAVSRVAGHFGNSKLTRTIAETSYEVYDANATAEDLKSAAKDLGLTQDEVEECRNPGAQGE